MARSRNIKPSFFENDELAECDPLARLLFIGLWTVADCQGVLEDRPRRIKAQVLPYDDCDIVALLDDLISKGFVRRFKADESSYLHVIQFAKHQNPHKKEEAKHPAPTEPSASPGLAPDKPSASPADSLLLIPDSGSLNPDPGEPGFDQFWKAYPKGRKTDKKKAKSAFAKAIKGGTAASTIIAAAKEYALSDVGRGEFVKMPTTWLNGGCWEDDRAAWAKLKPKQFDRGGEI